MIGFKENYRTAKKLTIQSENGNVGVYIIRQSFRILQFLNPLLNA